VNSYNSSISFKIVLKRRNFLRSKVFMKNWHVYRLSSLKNKRSGKLHI